MSRPTTLSQVADRIVAGEPAVKALGEFLDSFYLAEPGLRQAMFAKEPSLVGDDRIDALLGAVCEYLCKRYSVLPIPAWASGPCRFLDHPWFTTDTGSDGMREFLAFSSPAEFAHRYIFTEEQPLRRASMVKMRKEPNAPTLQP